LFVSILGPPRQVEYEGYYNREKSIKLSSNGEGGFGDQTAVMMSNPKPTFQAKRPPVNKWRPSSQYSQNPILYQNHMEMANLLSAQWRKVEDCLAKGKVEASYDTYKDKGPNKNLAGFQPFDLDKFCKQAPKAYFGQSPS
jgi:hypothetical protein